MAADLRAAYGEVEEIEMMDIKDQLDELANIYAERDMMLLDKQALLKDAMPAEVQARLDEIEAEFSGKLETANAKAAEIEAAIKEYVIGAGTSVKGSFLHAVYTKPRVTWDTKGIDGYSVAHPEINAFRKVGDPSVSIRKV